METASSALTGVGTLLNGLAGMAAVSLIVFALIAKKAVNVVFSFLK